MHTLVWPDYPSKSLFYARFFSKKGDSSRLARLFADRAKNCAGSIPRNHTTSIRSFRYSIEGLKSSVLYY